MAVKEQRRRGARAPEPEVVPLADGGRGLDLAAIGLTAAGLLTLISLAGDSGGMLTRGWAELLQRWIGWGAYLIPLVLLGAGVALAMQRAGRPLPVSWRRVLALEAAFFALLGVLAAFEGGSLPAAEAGYGGGLIGWAAVRILEGLLGVVGAGVALAVVAALALIAALRPEAGARAIPRLEPAARPEPIRPAVHPPAPDVPPPQPAREPEAPGRRPARLPAEFRKSFKVEPAPAARAAPHKGRDRRLPPLDVLEKGETVAVTSGEINRAAGLIEKTLAEFGLPVRVVGFQTGPTVTQYAVEPGFVEHPAGEGEGRRQKVRVSQISALASDLALALSAPSLRIEAPVPGQPYVGIEVPNRRPGTVRLRPLIESEAFRKLASPLAIALGRDVAGQPVTADLAAMPHLLVAGTTGSGKSVCLTALTACLVLNNTPEDLRLVLIDPKMVELVRFNGLPHLYGKVETELQRIVGVLRWCTQEMDRRYRLLEEARARDLEAFNRKARRRGEETLPRVVVMLDELADLMMMAPDQTERTLVRLAQMARATGMHLVVATQRPSTDIVTGLIKANFPARISFAVASGVDSRVILDGPGAETLLGRGDMLYLAPEAGAPVRVQGAYIGDLELEHLVEAWGAQGSEDEPAALPPRPPWEDLLLREREREGEEGDEVLERAIELVRRTGTASASMLQRRLRLGYPRAARLMDELERMGLIGRAQAGGRTREVLVGDEQGPEADAADDEEPEA